MTIEELFQTRELTASVNQIPAAGTFLQDLFFKKEDVSEAEAVDIEIKKGKRKMAPFVAPRMKGKVVEGAQKTVRTYKPAYIKHKFVTEAADVVQNANTVFYEAGSAMERAAAKLVDDLMEGKEYIYRRIEWMAAQALTTGKIIVKGDGVEDEIDFSFDVSQLPVLSGTALWSDTDSDPIKQMRAWRTERVKAGGIAPNVAVMGGDAVDAFINNAKVQNALDLRRMERGIINPEVLPKGVTYWGYIPEIATDIYSYDEWYIDDETGAEKAMVDAETVIYGSTQAKAKRVYGAIKDLKALYATKVFAKSWEEEDPSVRYLLMQSAPLVVPVEVDAFMSAKVL
ncbi:major capsid protein [Hydrogenimonas sp.]